ncbi:hypothetical protein GCM10020221_16140 [Streptomyces thioluteus]|uniref:Sugar ABC transporter permease n=1 Tax=Streptomyces thioluteus TaxID=66431 RepID=A0ABN3WN77_STRTU
MRRSLFGRIWPGATAVVLFLGFVFPVYWMFATAFKANKDIVGGHPRLVPHQPHHRALPAGPSRPTASGRSSPTR